MVNSNNVGLIENIDFAKDSKGEESINKTKTSTSSDCIESSVGHSSGFLPPGRDRDRTLLYRHLSIPEIDNLVGWATSHSGNCHDSQAKTASGDGERRLGLAHIPMAPPP